MESTFSRPISPLILEERLNDVNPTKPRVSSIAHSLHVQNARRRPKLPARGVRSGRDILCISLLSIILHYHRRLSPTNESPSVCLAQAIGSHCKIVHQPRPVLSLRSLVPPCPPCRARRTRTPTRSSSPSNPTSGAKRCAASTANNGPDPRARSIARRSIFFDVPPTPLGEPLATDRTCLLPTDTRPNGIIRR